MATTAPELSAKDKEDAVLTWLSLQDAEELEEVYTVISLECPNEKKGKKNQLLKYLLKHLCEIESSLEDKGLATMLVLYDRVGNFGQDKKPVITSGTFEKNDTATENVKSIVDVLKLKDLKISGTIGGTSEKDKLSYTSLSYQIANAAKSGYSEEQICASVVKAIVPGNNLRTYLESKRDLNLNTLTEILRSHFKEKDSASVFTELGNAVQQGTENSLDFVIRLMCLRQKVSDLAREEGCPYEQGLLNKRMFHAMFTGLTNSNIRVELRERCKNDVNISDTDLLKFVSEVVANESERSEKIGAKKSVNIGEIPASKGESNPNQSAKKENPFVKIEELKITHQKELACQSKQIAAIHSQLAEIKSALLEKRPGSHCQPNQGQMQGQCDQTYIPPHCRYNNRGQDSRRMRKKCPKCELEKSARCFHCFLCGSTEHMMFQCPNKKNE